MNTVLSIICAVIIFGAIVTIHEGGHFLVARLCGIKVSEFAIGMGPAIFKKQGKKTLFSIRALPIGGYCAMGEDDEEQSDDPAHFRNKPVWARMAVIVAGAAMNLILGFVLGIVILLADGAYISTEVAELTTGSDAAKHFMIGDEITAIDGRSVFTAGDVIYALRNSDTGTLSFDVKRNGEKLHIDAVTFSITEDEQGNRVLNYDFKVAKKELTPSSLLPQAGRSFVYYARLILMSFGDLIRGKYGLNDLQGPVGIVTAISQTAQTYGFDIGYLLDMAMLITINVGIFNLLPLPALDGGRFVFLIIEAIRKKPVTPQVEGAVHFAGFALLMLLMLALTFNDARRAVTSDEQAALSSFAGAVL